VTVNVFLMLQNIHHGFPCSFGECKRKKKYYFMNVAALNRVMTTLLTTKLSQLRTLLKSETFFFFLTFVAI